MKTYRYFIAAIMVPVILSAGSWFAARQWNSPHGDDSRSLNGTWLYSYETAADYRAIPAEAWRAIVLDPGATPVPPPEGTAPRFWFKRTIGLDTAFIARNPGLVVGRISDACAVYVNGVLIGATPGYHTAPSGGEPPTSDWNTFRQYPVPAGLLKAGDNEVALRVTTPRSVAPFRDPLRLVAARRLQEGRLFWDILGGFLYQFLSAALAMGAAMFMASYLVRRRDRHFLLYAILAGAIGLYLTMFFIFPLVDAGVHLFRFYFLLPIVIAGAFGTLAAGTDGRSPRITLIIAAVALVGGAIPAATLPWYRLGLLSLGAQGVAALLFLIAAVHLFRAMRRGVDEARILAPWSVLILASLIVDNLSYRLSLSLFTVPVSAAFGIATLGIWYAVQMARSRNELEDLTNTLEQKVKSRTEEMAMVARTFTEINDNLMDATRELEDYEISTRKDMALAANIQRSILPAVTPGTGEWDAAFLFRPMADVSGDFYDFYEIDGQFSGLGIFDVSGHGVSSGLITMIAKSAAWRQFRRGRGAPLSEVMAGINREILRDLMNVDNYLTGIVLRFDGDTVESVNAGHPELMMRRGPAVTNPRLPDGTAGTGTLLGIPGIVTDFPIVRFTVAPGDFLLIYTDCLIESRAGGEPYGSQRLAESLAHGPARSAQDMLDHLLNDFYGYAGGRESLRDDLTVIVLRRRGGTETPGVD